jgi:DNA-binding NarL/FixJ family response regulator
MKTLSKPVTHKVGSIRMIIADDHDIFRHGLQDILETVSTYQVVASCRNAKELIEAANKLHPDLIISDLKMPGISGIDAIRSIHQNQPSIRFLALTHFDDEFMIASALDAGVTGYVTKGVNKDELFQAIDAVYKNLTFYCKTTSHKLALMVKKGVYNPFSQKQKQIFSDTEKKMIALICDDKSSKEIAQQLSLSVRTVENYRSTIFRKMNVNSLAGMTVYAIKNGLYQYDQV